MSTCRFMIPILAITVALRYGMAQSDSTDSRRQEAAEFARLKTAVAANDRAAIARMFVYPTRVNRSSTSHFLVHSRAELLERFDSVLTPDVRRAILAQQPESLSYSWRGTMIGNGEAWIGGICSDGQGRHCHYGVTAINLGSSSSRGSLHQITRVEVSVGDDSCYVSPLTGGDSISALVRFIVKYDSDWKPGGFTELGGVHAELFSGQERIYTFGAALDRQQFEKWSEEGAQAQPASTAEIDAFLALVGLPPGTNAGLGLPAYPCPRRSR